MSWKATAAVRQHSQTVGTARMVLFLIADSANDAGWHSFDKQEDLASGANASTRAVERAIKAAIDIGELEVHRPDRSGRNQYSVMLPGLAIYESADERRVRDEHYENLSLGRAERTRQKRANRRTNRRSEDPTPASGPRPQGPDTSVGSSELDHPTSASGPDPTPASGHHPTPASGLKGNPNTNPKETPERELALAAEELWSCYPHRRRNLDPARTLDHLRGLEAADVASIEQIARALAEDIQSRDWQEGFGPSLSNWLRNRMWDRPLASVTELNPLAGIALAEPDPEFERAFRRDVNEDVWDIWIAQCWHGRRGDHYVLGGTARACGWISLRYGRVLDRTAQSLGYAGLVLVQADPPQITKENAA